MKHNLLNFTRGSQLLGHFAFMFAAGLKGPVILTTLVVLGTCYWEVRTSLTDHQFYLVWMHFYASLYAFMEFDPAKLVNLTLADGDKVGLPFAVVREFPPMRDAMDAFRTAAKQGLLTSAVFLGPAFVFFWWFAERFGGRSKERKHERGAMLVSLDELEDEIGRYNGKCRAEELSRKFGWKWRLASSSALAEAGHYTPAHLAGVSWPWRLEQSHTMLIGTTGTGKTVALTQLVTEARERGQRAVIFDLTGAFIEAYYDPARDIILNPIDARCPVWSVFNDCSSEAEFHAAAEALVPHDGGGSEQFWVLAARMLFVEMCLHLSRKGTVTNEALAQKLMTADLSEVHKLMRGTMADPLTAPEAARMAESIRAVFNANAKVLKLLPSDGPRFSVRDWVKGDCEPGSILFLSARYVDMSISSQLLTLWLDTAMNTLMTLERTQDLRMWFLIDELGALHRLPALEKGLQTARNFGGVIVTGVHAFAKLKEVYGENMAMTLSSLARTKLILATADRETATWCSDFIGHRQVRDMEEGFSYGYNNARDAVSLTPRRQVEPLLLPDQFMNLPRLSAYIKFPDGFPAAPVSLIPRSRERIAEGFIPREKPSSKSTKGSGSTSAKKRKTRHKTDGEHPASNDDGAVKPVDPKQLKLNLAGRDSPLDEARDHQQADSREQLEAWRQEGATRSRAGGNAVVDASATLPPSAVQTGDSSLVEAGEKDPAETGSANAKTSDRPLSPTQRPSREGERQPLRPAEKDLREGAVSDPPAKDLGEFEPDM
ncbi:type IV secretion system DNA-binding domain-containing protein [Pontixanthobacter aquaemixtae]|uniref:Type IV secretion system DNA-binding domain-containing protein n=1 Tax=Pontixanthobacter aquaemixtae TaxID=1958940 RepID=A0A844ZVU8_9SPHN|nr:type IV secretion system DNA-binding domain-containing protein [Pontixanthobacter aquaemixtae]MXO91076.1 type IV secretion system DNA-binding domain-containing protein [Pontixanthobacter aquaemixtae]